MFLKFLGAQPQRCDLQDPYTGLSKMNKLPHMSRETAQKTKDDSSDFILLGSKASASKLASALYIVATPIGNLKDITIRALEVLAACDLIACEDTRISRKLLSHYDIRTRLVTYHEHNAEKQRPLLLGALAEGKSIALISDAGTPLLSDPGYKLVEAILAEGFDILPVPGPSAMLSALVGAGLPTDQVHFAGFLPTKSGARIQKLESLKTVPGTLVFYESPRRLDAVMGAMSEQLGADRQAVVARELTKRFEEFTRGSLGELAEHYANSEAPKGEAVILVGSGKEEELGADDIEDMIRQALSEGLHVKQISADLATKTGHKKNEIYKMAQDLKDQLKGR